MILKAAARAASVSNRTDVTVLDSSSESAKHKESLGLLLQVLEEDESSTRNSSPSGALEEELRVVDGNGVAKQELVRKDLSFFRLVGDFSEKE
jgi:hypothetical protein